MTVVNEDQEANKLNKLRRKTKKCIADFWRNWRPVHYRKIASSGSLAELSDRITKFLDEVRPVEDQPQVFKPRYDGEDVHERAKAAYIPLERSLLRYKAEIDSYGSDNTFLVEDRDM